MRADDRRDLAALGGRDDGRYLLRDMTLPSRRGEEGERRYEKRQDRRGLTFIKGRYCLGRRTYPAGAGLFRRVSDPAETTLRTLNGRRSTNPREGGPGYNERGVRAKSDRRCCPY